MMEPGQVHADLVVELLQYHPLLTGEAVHGLLDELFRNAELGTGLFHQGPAGIIDVPVVDLLHQRVQRARLNPQRVLAFKAELGRQRIRRQEADAPDVHRQPVGVLLHDGQRLRAVMLIDTVGLVRRLPHHLVQAFKSTLEQAATADIILNICDASSVESQVHLTVTKTLLEELGCKDRPIIPVLNKCDLVPEINHMPMIGGAVRISAATGQGVDHLLEVIEENLPVKNTKVELLLPFSKSGLAAEIRKDGTVLQEEYVEEGLHLVAMVTPDLLQQVLPYAILGEE